MFFQGHKVKHCPDRFSESGHEDSAESNVNTDSSKDHDFNVSCNCNIYCDFNIYDTMSKTVNPTCPQQINYYVSENAIVDVTNVSEVENINVVSENDTNSAQIVSNNQPIQNDFTKCTTIMSIYHIDPYIAGEQSTDNYTPNDPMQNNVNIVMSTACNIESSFDTEAVNNLVNMNIQMFPELNDFREKHPKTFIFAHLNINFVHRKFIEVHEILILNLVDMLILGESKLHLKIFMTFNVENYAFYRNDRPGITKSTEGGGLVAYVLSSISHRERNDIAYNQDGIETIVFEVAMKREKWFFIGIYRPGSVIIRHLKSAIEYIC